MSEQLLKADVYYESKTKQVMTIDPLFVTLKYRSLSSIIIP